MKSVIKQLCLGFLFFIASLSFISFWDGEFQTWFWQLVVMVLVPIIYFMDRKIYRMTVRNKFLKP